MRFNADFWPTRVLTIARREFLSTARRREFILITLGLPLLYALLFGVIFTTTVTAVNSEESRQMKESPPLIGFFDATYRLDTNALTETENGFAGRCFASVSAGEHALRSGQIRAFVSVNADFFSSGIVTVYELPGSFVGDLDEDVRSSYVRLLRRAILTPIVAPSALKLALLPVRPDALILDKQTGKFVVPSPLRDVAKFAIPYAVSLLLLLSVLLASSYLLHGIVEEKESRIIEFLVSSVSHEELLLGKMVGLGGVGLLQLGIWFSTGILLAVILKPASVLIGGGPALVSCGIVMFLLGYTLYASILAGIGSLGSSWKESQQIAGIAGSVLTVPILFLPVILQDPDGPCARVLSIFPLTAPNAMVLRVAAGGGSVADFAVSVACLVVSSYWVIKMSSRLFRISSLMNGQRVDLTVVLRTLRSRQ